MNACRCDRLHLTAPCARSCSPPQTDLGLARQRKCVPAQWTASAAVLHTCSAPCATHARTHAEVGHGPAPQPRTLPPLYTLSLRRCTASLGLHSQAPVPPPSRPPPPPPAARRHVRVHLCCPKGNANHRLPRLPFARFAGRWTCSSPSTRWRAAARRAPSAAPPSRAPPLTRTTALPARRVRARRPGRLLHRGLRCATHSLVVARWRAGNPRHPSFPPPKAASSAPPSIRPPAAPSRPRTAGSVSGRSNRSNRSASALRSCSPRWRAASLGSRGAQRQVRPWAARPASTEGHSTTQQHTTHRGTAQRLACQHACAPPHTVGEGSLARLACDTFQSHRHAVAAQPCVPAPPILSCSLLTYSLPCPARSPNHRVRSCWKRRPA